MKTTVVIPVFNELDSLEPLVEGVLEWAGEFGPHILFVDDGSTDGSSEKLDELHRRYPQVDVIRFARNQGKSAALAAGFEHADGNVVITMDADLQDDPKEIPRFLAQINNQGLDLAVGWKQVRHDPPSKTFPSRVYNSFADRLFGLGLHDMNCGFKAMRPEVAKSLKLFGDMHRLIPVLAAEKGYKVGEIEVEHHPRRHGKSKYGNERFLRGAADLITLYFLTRHKDAPNHFFGGAGILAGAASAVFFLYALLMRSGTALVGALVLLTGGAILVGLGLVAELVLRLHVEKPSATLETEKFFH